MLLTLIDGEELDTARVELATPLVVRASTAAPNNPDVRAPVVAADGRSAG